MTGLTQIPWEGESASPHNQSTDATLKADLQAFIDRTNSTDTMWEHGLWNHMALLARRTEIDADTLKKIRLSFIEMAEEANKLAQKKLS